MVKKAWMMERELRDSAVPFDRRKNNSAWYAAGFEVPRGDVLIDMFWSSKVPGSFAPEIPYQEMIQSMDNMGYDVSEAEGLIPQGIALQKERRVDDLRVLTSRLLNLLNNAQKIPAHPYHAYEHPDTWEAICKAMPIKGQQPIKQAWRTSFADQIHQGWLGQLAGGSFGTTIEGYTGRQIATTYGKITSYITPPETTNDDVVYELVLLDVFEKMGYELTSEAIGLQWVKQIPFGWSAEWIALRNLSMGIFPPQSGEYLNPYTDWIGAQMRGMICGMLAPSSPLQAAKLAFEDARVSHARNGIYGEMYAAVLTALAFEMTDMRSLVKKASEFIPAKSEYAAKLNFVIKTLEEVPSKEQALENLLKHFEAYNWIHAYPNMAADVYSLWYGQGDFSLSMSLLAEAGNDVDCNAGLVGNVLGISYGVPKIWSDPLNDLLETYITGKEKVRIHTLAEKTTAVTRTYYQ
ncbi:MAG: ADP-ribosylglycohydrolase family protein [Anaerolineaceae bacterium]